MPWSRTNTSPPWRRDTNSSMWPRKLVDGVATRLAGVHRDDARNARTVVMERLAIPAPTVTLFNRLIVRRYATAGARELPEGYTPGPPYLQGRPRETAHAASPGGCLSV